MYFKIKLEIEQKINKFMDKNNSVVTAEVEVEGVWGTMVMD